MTKVSESAILEARGDASELSPVAHVWPSAVRPSPCTHDHRVAFYEDEGFLARKVARFLADALHQGGCAIAVATEPHLANITRELSGVGVDLEQCKQDGRWFALDASKTLETFMQNGKPDGERFREQVGALVAKAQKTADSKPLRIYGEMVDVLWKAGNADAVMELEDLWNELASHHDFSLLCGYVLNDFADTKLRRAFEEICYRHSDVHTESVEGVPLNSTSRRIIADLEQRACSLETEVGRRQRLSARMERLLDLTGELAHAAGTEKIASIIVDKGIEAVGADTAAIWLLDHDHHELVMLKSRGYSRQAAERFARVPLDGSSALAAAVRRREPIFIESYADCAAHFPDSVQAVREATQFSEIAFACLPLLVDGRALGGLTYTFSRERRFDDGDRTFLRILKRQSAQAIDRARLYDAERTARLAAEAAQTELARALHEEREAHLLAKEATRAREEILSVVSHDLRNPLGAILMTAASLLQTDLVDKKTHRVRALAERVHRNAERMASLIEDLVDFASIQAGQLPIDPKPYRAEEIVLGVAEMLQAVAEERGLRLETRVTSEIGPVYCDRERLIQALSNLVSNAVKVTASGGCITVGVDAVSGETVFWVQDTGPGIDPNELPQIFDRYFRSKRAGYKGAGLGLSIAKGIVDAHGGRIWAESELGRGSLFSLAVPRAAR